MTAIRFEFSTEFLVSAAAVWDFHMRPDALKKLTPWWMMFRIVEPGDGVVEGALVKAVVGLWPLRAQWHALISSVEAGRSFTDMAVKAPVRYWLHQHIIEPISPNRSRLRDVIWVLPPAWMPLLIARPVLKVALSLLFAWRHNKTGRTVNDTRFDNQSFEAARQRPSL